MKEHKLRRVAHYNSELKNILTKDASTKKFREGTLRLMKGKDQLKAIEYARRFLLDMVRKYAMKEFYLLVVL